MLTALVAGGVIALDQLTKWWALSALADRTIDLFWTLRLQLTHNTGASFSIASGSGGLIAILALAVVVAFIVMGRGLEGRWSAAALGLILGGALSNLLDRAFRSGSGGFFGGAVVDFIDPQWWPVFNLADSAIVIGGILLVITTARE